MDLHLMWQQISFLPNQWVESLLQVLLNFKTKSTPIKLNNDVFIVGLHCFQSLIEKQNMICVNLYLIVCAWKQNKLNYWILGISSNFISVMNFIYHQKGTFEYFWSICPSVLPHLLQLLLIILHMTGVICGRGRYPVILMFIFKIKPLLM